MKPVFAIDVGGVLASKQHDGMPVQYSLESIGYLSNFFDCWVVSMCGSKRAALTRDWLFMHGFERYISPSKQIYIPFKDENKNEILKKIHARFFVDDREKHLTPARELGSLDSLYKFDPAAEADTKMNWVVVPNWVALTCHLLGWVEP